MTDLAAQCTERIVNNLYLVGAEKDNVAVLCAGTFDNGLQCRLMQILDDRRLQTSFVKLRDIVDLDVSQSLSAIDADEFSIVVDLTARECSTTRYAQRRDATVPGIRHTCEHFERNILHCIGNFGQLQRYTQVRLVGPVTCHCFLMRDARKRIGQIDIHCFLENAADQLFHQRGDLRLGQERGLDIHLGEFRLTVSAQVFVAKTFGDLIIAVKTCHHQQLLEQLWRLWQCEKLSRVYARWHQIIARAFRCGFGQHRRFDVDKTAAVEETAKRHRHLVTQHHVLLHLRTAQIDYSMCQAHCFGQVFVVQLERGRQRRIQHLDLVTQYLDLAAGNIRIGSTFRAVTHTAGDAQYELAAH